MSEEILKIHKRSAKESILEQQLSSTDGFLLQNFLRTYFGTFISFSIRTHLVENITYLTQLALEVLNLFSDVCDLWWNSGGSGGFLFLAKISLNTSEIILPSQSQRKEQLNSTLYLTKKEGSKQQQPTTFHFTNV